MLVLARAPPPPSTMPKPSSRRIFHMIIWTIMAMRYGSAMLSSPGKVQALFEQFEQLCTQTGACHLMVLHEHLSADVGLAVPSNHPQSIGVRSPNSGRHFGVSSASSGSLLGLRVSGKLPAHWVSRNRAFVSAFVPMARNSERAKCKAQSSIEAPDAVQTSTVILCP